MNPALNNTAGNTPGNAQSNTQSNIAGSAQSVLPSGTPSNAPSVADNAPNAAAPAASDIPAFLQRNIGSLVQVEFLVCNAMIDRVGVLTEVGETYIVLRSIEGSSRIMCDIGAIMFVTVISQNAGSITANSPPPGVNGRSLNPQQQRNR
jgi:hypothetical protein